MSGPDDCPTVSHSFDVATEIDTLKAQIAVFTEKCESLTIEIVDGIHIPPPAMSCKNKVTFSGKSDQRVADFIDHMKNLKLANNWTDDQLAGQTVVAFDGEALGWLRN